MYRVFLLRCPNTHGKCAEDKTPLLAICRVEDGFYSPVTLHCARCDMVLENLAIQVGDKTIRHIKGIKELG